MGTFAHGSKIITVFVSQTDNRNIKVNLTNDREI